MVRRVERAMGSPKHTLNPRERQPGLDEACDRVAAFRYPSSSRLYAAFWSGLAVKYAWV